MTTSIYEYLRFAGIQAEGGEDTEYAQFKGHPLDGPVKSGGEYIEADPNFDDPLLRLESTVRFLVMYCDIVVEKHTNFDSLLEPLLEEFAAIYPGLLNISGFEARSHCKALESFAWHVVRYTFDALDRFTPDEELDDEFMGGEMQRPFTASSDYPTCCHLAEAFDGAEIEDRVHEAIEQECDDAWTLLRSKSLGQLEATTQDANSKNLFPKDIPQNSDIVDLVVRIDSEPDQGRSQRQIALEFTQGDKNKAGSLLAQIRRLRREGRINR